ncbi:MAG: DUF3553 domain-containing protein [Rhodoferax sp.]|jgi:hypothetical protein|nr:DUF3553 domain-containing protein [Rhodoferax sp.]
MEKLKKGQRVKHTSRPEWGLGQLREDENANEIRVFFPNKGELTLQTADRGKLELVIGAEPLPVIPPNVPTKKTGKKQMPMVTFDMAKELFLKQYLGGFYGKRLLDEERDYKVELARVAQQLLAKDVLLALINAENYQQICDNANTLVCYKKKKVPNNLPSFREQIGFTAGFKKLNDPKTFAHSLFEYLHGDANLELRFNRFALVLEQMEAAKWPIITTFRFFLFPATDVFIKPKTLKYRPPRQKFKINCNLLI